MIEQITEGSSQAANLKARILAAKIKNKEIENQLLEKKKRRIEVLTMLTEKQS